MTQGDTPSPGLPQSHPRKRHTKRDLRDVLAGARLGTENDITSVYKRVVAHALPALPESEGRSLVPYLSIESLGKGSVLTRAGQVPSALYVVVDSGRVSLYEPLSKADEAPSPARPTQARTELGDGEVVTLAARSEARRDISNEHANSQSPTSEAGGKGHPDDMASLSRSRVSELVREGSTVESTLGSSRGLGGSTASLGSLPGLSGSFDNVDAAMLLGAEGSADSSDIHADGNIASHAETLDVWDADTVQSLVQSAQFSLKDSVSVGASIGGVQHPVLPALYTSIVEDTVDCVILGSKAYRAWAVSQRKQYLDDDMKFFRNLATFGTYSESTAMVSKFTMLFKRAYYKRGHVLSTAGEKSAVVRLLREGEALMQYPALKPVRKDINLSTVGPGTFLGAMSALSGLPEPFNTTCVTDVVVLEVPRRHLSQLGLGVMLHMRLEQSKRAVACCEKVEKVLSPLVVKEGEDWRTGNAGLCDLPELLVEKHRDAIQQLENGDSVQIQEGIKDPAVWYDSLNVKPVPSFTLRKLKHLSLDVQVDENSFKAAVPSREPAATPAAAPVPFNAPTQVQSTPSFRHGGFKAPTKRDPFAPDVAQAEMDPETDTEDGPVNWATVRHMDAIAGKRLKTPPAQVIPGTGVGTDVNASMRRRQRSPSPPRRGGGTQPQELSALLMASGTIAPGAVQRRVAEATSLRRGLIPPMKRKVNAGFELRIPAPVFGVQGESNDSDFDLTDASDNDHPLFSFYEDTLIDDAPVDAPESQLPPLESPPQMSVLGAHPQEQSVTVLSSPFAVDNAGRPVIGHRKLPGSSPQPSLVRGRLQLGSPAKRWAQITKLGHPVRAEPVRHQQSAAPTQHHRVPTADAHHTHDSSLNSPYNRSASMQHARRRGPTSAPVRSSSRVDSIPVLESRYQQHIAGGNYRHAFHTFVELHARKVRLPAPQMYLSLTSGLLTRNMYGPARRVARASPPEARTRVYMLVIQALAAKNDKSEAAALLAELKRRGSKIT